MAKSVGERHRRAPSVHLALSYPWRAVIDSYRGDDETATATNPVLALPNRYAAGDTVIHVVHAQEPAILNIEELETGSGDDTISVVDRAGADLAGISVRAVEMRLGQTLPEPPATLDPEFAERLIAAIAAESSDPTPWYVTDTAGCLARVRAGAISRETRVESRCTCCGEVFGSAALWDVRRALDWHMVDADADADTDTENAQVPDFAAVRVCASCHAILHTPFGPSVEELMYAWRPECPRCGALRADELIWGMPAGPPPAGTRLMGCVIGPDGTPNYECSDCGHQWYADEHDDDRPVWHREDEVVIEWRGGKTITVTDLMRSTLDDVRDILIEVARRGETITYGDLAGRSGGRYSPMSMGRLMDVLSVDCHERDEPSLAALVVSASTGEVGSTFVGDAVAGRAACHDYWNAQGRRSSVAGFARVRPRRPPFRTRFSI